MRQDRLDERARELFQAAREEAPTEETRRRIEGALRAAHQGEAPPSMLGPRRSSRAALRMVLAVAAVALGAGLVISLGSTPERVEIAAEHLPGGTTRHAQLSPAPSSPVQSPPAPAESMQAPTGQGPDAVASDVAVDPAASSVARRDSAAGSLAPRQRPTPVAPAPPSLQQELSAIQKARGALDHGDARTALGELMGFGRSPGWRELGVEANLLRIEALAELGRVEEARKEAARFVSENPNNPLVDRAESFTHTDASPDDRRVKTPEGE